MALARLSKRAGEAAVGPLQEGVPGVRSWLSGGGGVRATAPDELDLLAGRLGEARALGGCSGGLRAR